MKISALNHVLCWTPGTSRVALIPWPDTRGQSGAYAFTALACDTEVHRLTLAERRAHVLAEALSAIIRDGVPAEAAHRSLLALQECRDMMPADSSGEPCAAA